VAGSKYVLRSNDVPDLLNDRNIHPRRLAYFPEGTIIARNTLYLKLQNTDSNPLAIVGASRSPSIRTRNPGQAVSGPLRYVSIPPIKKEQSTTVEIRA
jgi:hypothetical protein